MGLNPKKELNSGQFKRQIGKPNMNLDESQRKKVAEWIKQGLKLAEIQNRLVAELGVKMTYMEVRLLVDDLKREIKQELLAQKVAAKLDGTAQSRSAAVIGQIGHDKGSGGG